MREGNYRSYLEAQEFAASTIATRLSTLRIVERAEGIDLDKEYENDELRGLLERYAYSTDDFRAGRPNPTKLKIEPERLYQYLALNRSHITSYRNYCSAGSNKPFVPESGSEEEELIVEEAGRTFAL